MKITDKTPFIHRIYREKYRIRQNSIHFIEAQPEVCFYVFFFKKSKVCEFFRESLKGKLMKFFWNVMFCVELEEFE